MFDKDKAFQRFLGKLGPGACWALGNLGPAQLDPGQLGRTVHPVKMAGAQPSMASLSRVQFTQNHSK